MIGKMLLKKACLKKLFYPAGAEGIGCFVCHSVEGSDPGCEDPFAQANSYYWEECLATKHNDDRDSFSNNNQSDDDTELYLASHCIKVSGIFSK